MTETEFYDQQKWLKIHENADQLFADDKTKRVVAALYLSPEAMDYCDRRRIISVLEEVLAESR